MRSVWGLILAVLASSAAATTYQFEGNTYTTPLPPFTTAMRVTGQFTTAQPLPANMALTAIGPQGTNRVTDWRFHDGITTYTPQNSTVFGESVNFSFQIATDANGAISDYRIALISPLPPHSLNQPVNAFLIQQIEGFAITAVDGDTPCLGVDPNGVCGATDDQVRESFGGTWVAYEVHSPVPALARQAQLLMLIALAAAGLWVLRRHGGES